MEIPKKKPITNKILKTKGIEKLRLVARGLVDLGLGLTCGPGFWDYLWRLVRRLSEGVAQTGCRAETPFAQITET